ncbi:glycosyl hydrolase family 8 [Caulobacter segnis]
MSACAAPSSPKNWAAYKSRFIQSDGRVVDTGNGNVSHSEGQGFAMIMATAYDDPATFKKLWSWTDKTLARSKHAPVPLALRSGPAICMSPIPTTRSMAIC